MRGTVRVRTNRQVIALLIISVLVAAACGSTVSPQQQEAAEVSGEELGDLSSGGLPPGARVNEKGQIVNAQGEVIGNTDDLGVSGGPGSVAGGTEGVGDSGPGVAAAAPGVTATKIYFGVGWSDAGEANRALGAGASLESDARDYYNVMIEVINKAGGLAGREIVPIYHEYDPMSSQPIQQQQQAACARYTQDNEVFGILEGDKVLQECAKKAGAINPVPGGASLPEDFRTYPHYVEISGMNLIRVGPVTITGLHREGYFGKEPKIGIALWDLPNYRGALKRGYLPALADRGLKLATEPAYITAPSTFQDFGATSADINSAVLRFQSQGITHVMLLDGPTDLCRGACLGTLFLRRAEQQNYNPRYGFNEFNVPVAAYEEGLYPRSQVRRSIALGWDDSDKSADEGWHLNRPRERCYKLMRKQGVPLNNANQEADARSACEQFWFIQTIIEVKMAGAPISADNFIRGVNALGWSFTSPSAYAVHLSATQHDGVAAARNMRFLDSCDCYRYTTEPYRV